MVWAMVNLQGKMRFTSEARDVLVTLEDKNDHAKQLAIVEEHIHKFVAGEIPWDAMYTFVPNFRLPYENILQINNQLGKDHIQEPEKLNEIVNNLEILLKHLIALGILSDYFISQNENKIEVIKRFPVSLAEVILLTFAHCKDSTTVYKYNENPPYYKDVLDVQKKIYQSASEVHAKLIKILSQYSTYNIANGTDPSLLTGVLSVLLNLSTTLMGFNVKLSADTWNCFLILIKKHSEILYGLFSFERPLKILMEFSINGLENIIRDFQLTESSEECFAKVIQQLKEHRFIIKVIIKIYQKIAWRNSDSITFWLYFVQLYRFSEPIMLLRKSNEKLIQLINQYIFHEVQPLLCAVIRGFKFKELVNPSNELLAVSIESRSEFLILINSILSSTNINLNNNDTLDILQAVFNAVQHSKCTDFFRNKIVISSNDLYSELMANLTCITLTLSKDSYIMVEAMIVRNIFSENTNLGLFSLDLFCVLIRNTNSSFCYDVICDLIDRTLPLIKAMRTETPDHFRLSYLLRMLYCHGSLDEHMRSKLLTKYPLPSMPGPWRHLGLQPIPKSRAFVKSMMLEYAEKAFEEFKEGQTSGVANFMQMIQYLDMLVSISHKSWSPADRSKLITIIEKLWLFNGNNFILLAHPLFITYLKCVTNITIENMEAIPGDLIKKIINQVKTITASYHCNDKFKFLAIILVTKCISALSTNKDISGAIDQSTIANLLNVIFVDTCDNNFLKSQALCAIEYSDKIILSDYINAFGSLGEISADATYFPGLNMDNVRFGSSVEFLQHECIDWSAVADKGVCLVPGSSSSSRCNVAAGDVRLPQINDRNIKEQIDDVTKALDCIRDDLKALQTYHKTFKFSQKNVSGIFNIIDELKRLV